MQKLIRIPAKALRPDGSCRAGSVICFKSILGLWLLLISSWVGANPVNWKEIAPGIEYTQLSNYPNFPGGNLHAFRIDLGQNQFKIAIADPKQAATDPRALLSAHQAILTVNGGFFTPELTPLGLLISTSQQLSPIKSTPWWGVFYIQKEQAHIVAQRDFVSNPEIDFAIQSGPRLIINDIIPAFNPKIDYRTAIGITRSGKIILLATENLLLSTTELARIMRDKPQEGGLDCLNAINFDGGHSTQLYAQMPNFTLQIPSYTPIADWVLVIPRK